MPGTALVVGASGFLGRAVTDRLQDEGWTVVGTYCSTPTEGPDEAVAFDFWTDDLGPVVTGFGVDAVVFAAAVEYGGEADTGDSDVEARFWDRAQALASAVGDRPFVYVSSAAVYRGLDGKYVESDPPSPSDGYGVRLFRFEATVRTVCENAAILRTSYLFGFSGGELDDRLAETRDRLTDGERVAYFSDMYKSPVEVSEAARAVGALLAREVTGIVHAPAPRTSVYEFHRDAMTALGVETSGLEAEPIPPDMDVAPDRSLGSERFEDLVGFTPSAVGPALERRLDDGSR